MTVTDPLVQPEWSRDTNGDRWWRFHQAHPEVGAQLLKFSREWRKARPGERCSLKMLWERLRWDHALALHHAGYKLNNVFTPMYARWLMENYSDLAEPPIFVTRQRSSADMAPPNPTRGPNGAENGARTTSHPLQDTPPVEIPSLWRVLGPNGRSRHLIRRSVEGDPEAEGLCGLTGEPRRGDHRVPKCGTCSYRLRELLDPQPVDDDGDNGAPESVL